MCEISLTPTSAVIISALGCWSVGFWSALSLCLAARSCKVHSRCRRCLVAAASAAMMNGFSGLALALLGLGLRPDSPQVVTGASLIIGGLAGLARADWHALTMEAFRGALSGALKVVERGAANHDNEPTNPKGDDES